MLFRVFLGNSLFSTFPKQLGNGRKSEFFFLPKPTNKINFTFSDAVKDDFFCLFLHFFQKKSAFFRKLPFFRKVKITIKGGPYFFVFFSFVYLINPTTHNIDVWNQKNTRDWCDFFGPAFPFCLVLFFHFFWYFSILFWTFYFPFSPFFTFFFVRFPRNLLSRSFPLFSLLFFW